MSALGMIESRGLVAAVVAADAMLKAADVRLCTRETVGGGLVTVFVKGDVASVQAATKAGALAAEQMGAVVTTHVIARLDDGVSEVLQQMEAESTLAITPAKKAEEPLTQPAENTTKPAKAKPAAKNTATGKADISPEMLRQMTVQELRQLARSMPNLGLDKAEIRYAKKTELLEKMLERG